MSLRLSTAPHIRCGDTTRSLMFNVIIALVPAAIAGIYHFGQNALILVLTAMVSAVFFEGLYQKIAKRPLRIMDCSALLTGLLIGLNMPPMAPFWLPIVGSFFAVVIVKQLFGGIGGNFMNPALAARAVLLSSWPVYMTRFVLPTDWSGVDAVVSATPLTTGAADTWNLFFGNIPGSIGEVSKMMILLGLVYLVLTRTISLRIPLTMVATTFALTWIFKGSLDAAVYAILSGGLLFGAVFMATDYVTSPMTAKGQIAYAFGCGLLVWVIRNFGVYPEGVTYAILLMNIATPLLDKYIRPRVYGLVKEAGKHA